MAQLTLQGSLNTTGSEVDNLKCSLGQRCYGSLQCDFGLVWIDGWSCEVYDKVYQEFRAILSGKRYWYGVQPGDVRVRKVAVVNDAHCFGRVVNTILDSNDDVEFEEEGSGMEVE